MSNGYLKNRNKRTDNPSDVAPSLKHDAEAEVGELFWSREAGKLSFKKDIGDFVRYEFAQSLVGPQGPIGPQGTPGPVGPAGLEWQGVWVSGDTYAIDDAVGYDGASWFCIAPTSGTTVPDLDTTHWALLAAQGATGPQGPQGLAAPSNTPEVIGLKVENGTLVTGVAGVAVKSASILVPANTLGTRELLEIVWSTVRVTGNNGGITAMLFLNTADTLTGAVQLATGTTISAASSNVKTGRDTSIISGQGLISPAPFNHNSDYTAINTGNTGYTFNTAVDNYFIFATVNGSVLDKSAVNRIRITRYSN